MSKSSGEAGASGMGCPGDTKREGWLKGVYMVRLMFSDTLRIGFTEIF
jgi:hypothetical protein